MKGNDLYERLLGLERPWRVKSVEMDTENKVVEVRVECRDKTAWVSEDGRRLHIHDWEEREWRELNTLQFQTKIVCKVPRLKDPDSGKTVMAAVPWAGKHSRFTLMFEAFAVELLLASSSVEAARKLLGLDWRAVDEIRRRAVERGLACREDEPVRYLGIDEKSFRKGHKYVSVASDLEAGRVLEVVDGRTEASADELMGAMAGQLETLKAAAMDMWPAYMNALRRHAWHAFVVHDRFHVSQHLTDAIDSVRKQEHRELKADADESLKDIRWTLLKRDHSEDEAEAFAALERKGLKVAKAWNLRELFDRFWKFKCVHAAERFVHKWSELARQSGLEPMIKAAKMLENHLEGLLGYCKHPITNAGAEGFNSKIQTVKSNARGFRSFEKFRIAILFYCGKLDMIPR
jgi:transposase